ncbi:MAG TPA: alpha/beta hydrolase [Croceibacterium sp.]
MAHYLELDAERVQRDPLILTVPGLAVGPRHWLSLWEQQCSDCRRVNLAESGAPLRNSWVNRLNLAIHQAGRPVVLVAHGLGCVATAWWAEYERPQYGNPVVGALLVAPPDVDRPGTDPRLARFASCPRAPLPFPSFLAASQDDPLCTLRTAQLLASDWGSRFAFAGAVGHIDGESRLGDWLFGKRLLAQLLREHRLEIGREEPADVAFGAPIDASYAQARLMEQTARHH